MPIYEYRCAACGEVFARIQSITKSADPVQCPKCNSGETERILSTFAAGSSSSEPASYSGNASCGISGGG